MELTLIIGLLRAGVCHPRRADRRHADEWIKRIEKVQRGGCHYFTAAKYGISVLTTAERAFSTAIAFSSMLCHVAQT